MESDEFWDKVGEPTGDVRRFAEAHNMCDAPRRGSNEGGDPDGGHLTAGNDGGDARGSGTTDNGGKEHGNVGDGDEDTEDTVGRQLPQDGKERVGRAPQRDAASCHLLQFLFG